MNCPKCKTDPTPSKFGSGNNTMIFKPCGLVKENDLQTIAMLGCPMSAWQTGYADCLVSIDRSSSIKTWNPGMALEETKDLAYWERNVLALKYADGFYKDTENNYPGWLRVLSLEGGKITFHIPDDFNVGDLPEIEKNWDGHTTEEKWKRILIERGIK